MLINPLNFHALDYKTVLKLRSNQHTHTEECTRVREARPSIRYKLATLISFSVDTYNFHTKRDIISLVNCHNTLGNINMYT